MAGRYATAREGNVELAPGFGPAEAMDTVSAREQIARGELTSPRSRRLLAAACAVCGALCIAVWFSEPSLGIGEFLGLFATFLVLLLLAQVAVVFGVYVRRHGFSGREVVGALVTAGWYAVVYLSLSATLLVVACFCLLMRSGQLVWAHQDTWGASR